MLHLYFNVLKEYCKYLLFDFFATIEMTFESLLRLQKCMINDFWTPLLSHDSSQGFPLFHKYLSQKLVVFPIYLKRKYILWSK